MGYSIDGTYRSSSSTRCAIGYGTAGFIGGPFEYAECVERAAATCTADAGSSATFCQDVVAGNRAGVDDIIATIAGWKRCYGMSCNDMEKAQECKKGQNGRRHSLEVSKE
tara:strand:- start:356 stop:685 length:330 start_codon:yes stop_codon:yes gene_type:complete